jgi:hypothetical protein
MTEFALFTEPNATIDTNTRPNHTEGSNSTGGKLTEEDKKKKKSRTRKDVDEEIVLAEGNALVILYKLRIIVKNPKRSAFFCISYYAKKATKYSYRRSLSAHWGIRIYPAKYFVLQRSPLHIK